MPCFRFTFLNGLVQSSIGSPRFTIETIFTITTIFRPHLQLRVSDVVATKRKHTQPQPLSPSYKSVRSCSIRGYARDTQSFRFNLELIERGAPVRNKYVAIPNSRPTELALHPFHKEQVQEIVSGNRSDNPSSLYSFSVLIYESTLFCLARDSSWF